MRRLLLFIVICLLPMAALAQEESATTTEATIALPLPISLDPVSLSRFDASGRDITENLFVGLTRLNARTGQVEPWLAESWTISEDGLTWTFNLRDDIQWVSRNASTGEFAALRPVVAGDVVFALQRACDRNRPSPAAQNIFILSGCRDLTYYNAIQAPSPDILAVRAVDETTLEVRLVFASGYFLSMTTLPEFRPLPAEIVDDVNGNWLRPDSLVTSGPWGVQNWLIGGSMQLVRNPFWPDVPEGNLESLTIRFDVLGDIMASEVNGGALDLARLSQSQANAAQTTSADVLKSRGEGPLLVLGFSFNNLDSKGEPILSPLDNPAVRRALALALDRDALVTATYGPNATVADVFTPLAALAAPSTPGASFDPTTAANTLAAAGYPNCAGIGQLTIATTQEDYFLAQNMVAQWASNLACSPDIFPLHTTTRAAILSSAHRTVDVGSTSPFPLWIIRWSADYPDAQAWIADALHCDWGYFRVGRDCTQADMIMDQAGLSTDVMSRFTAYNQVETELFGAQGTFPVIPLALEQNWVAINPALSGVGAYGPLQFDRWTKDVP